MNIKLLQSENLPDAAALARFSQAVVVVPDSGTTHWQQLPHGKLLQQRMQNSHAAKQQHKLLTVLPDASATHVSLGQCKATASTFECLSLARKLVQPLLDEQPGELGLLVAGFKPAQAEAFAEALIAAVLAATADLPNFKSRQAKQTALKKLHLFGVKTRHGFKQTFATAAGNNLARSLSMLPPNKLTPTEYLQTVRKLAGKHQWKLEFYGVPELKKRKAGAYLAVVQGSPKADAGIVRLRYTPKGGKAKSKQAPVVLVGKGLCYDSGGTNLKTARSMFGMQEDMQGSAVALGTFLALTELKVNYPVEAWLALAMNHIGPNAYKPNDVITAADGTTIEVVHTDAEGRMVLADTLYFASSEKPRLIVDYATLTGSCVQAIGSNYCGAFSNRDDWHQSLIEAGRASGERVWPFPMDADYEKEIESKIADIKQCSPEGGVDHILAARFLQRFVKHNTPWLHIDLSSMNRKGGLAHIPTDSICQGVRFTLNLLQEQKLV
ncbi:MAG: leucyl aminopeptidase family protein [Gammaproteobacteria bacterium]